MIEGQGNDLAGDLVRVHRAITRGFAVATDASYRFARDGFDDEELKQGFLDYVQAHVEILAAHHEAEDVTAFPRLRLRLPEAPYDELQAEHRYMGPNIDQIRLAILDIRVGVHVKESLDVLVYALNNNRELWRPHILKEEQNFSAEALAGALSAAEQCEIRAALLQSSIAHTRRDSLVIPFLLYNLSGAGRAAFRASLPPVVAERVLGDWRPAWRRMIPFLLA
ncbi:MAG TPA: hemerythrin domain-containing protein [Anaerolineaceae bacterium]|nr:hemerythrin domain-containing protein [Anaerolineaceae bacterium]